MTEKGYSLVLNDQKPFDAKLVENAAIITQPAEEEQEWPAPIAMTATALQVMNDDPSQATIEGMSANFMVIYNFAYSKEQKTPAVVKKIHELIDNFSSIKPVDPVAQKLQQQHLRHIAPFVRDVAGAQDRKAVIEAMLDNVHLKVTGEPRPKPQPFITSGPNFS